MAWHVLQNPHDQPLELMPLHLLRDYMIDNPNHPIAGKFNWERIPERLQLDRSLRHHTEKQFDDVLEEVNGRWQQPNVYAGVSRAAFNNPDGPGHAAVIKKVKAEHPWATEQDLADSARRNHRRVLREGTYQTAVTHSAPEKITAAATAPDNGDHPDSPERFAAYRAPAGGIVVRGLFYAGGSMVPDLKKFASKKVQYRRHFAMHWKKFRLRYPIDAA